MAKKPKPAPVGTPKPKKKPGPDVPLPGWPVRDGLRQPTIWGGPPPARPKAAGLGIGLSYGRKM